MLDLVLFMRKRDILSRGFSACVGMCVFDSEDSLINMIRFILTSSPTTPATTCDDALRAKRLAEVSIEELKPFFVKLTFSETQRFFTCWDRHVALEDGRLMEISVVVEAEIGLVVDAIKFGWSGLLSLVLTLPIADFFSAYSQIGYALLTWVSQRLHSFVYFDLSLDFVNQTHLFSVENPVRV